MSFLKLARIGNYSTLKSKPITNKNLSSSTASIHRDLMQGGVETVLEESEESFADWSWEVADEGDRCKLS